MKKSDMQDIKNSRENLIGFLSIYDIKKIEEYGIACNKKSFYEICDTVLRKYEEKDISNKKASLIMSILRDNNSRFKTESHRYEAGKIFEY